MSTTPSLQPNTLALRRAPAPAVRVLPPLPRAGDGAADVSPAQRRLTIAGIVALHAAAVWGLMQVDAVREAVLKTAPMLFVDLVAPPTPPNPVPPPPTPRPLRATPPPSIIAAAPSPAPAAFVVPAPPPPEAAEAAPPAPMVAVAVAIAPPQPPRVIPASAVQFAEAPQPEYPRQSRRNGEAGLVVVRAFIDAAGGAARSVQVEKSSGHARLDQAALTAVQKARFKPYTENGRPVEGWALVPLNFELEK